MDPDRKAAAMATLEAHPFEAPEWLKSRHRQSSFNAMHRAAPAVPLRHERWNTPDGDFLDLYFHESGEARPRVLLLHGLEDNARSPYIAGFQHALAEAGFDSVIMEFRSCGNELNHAPRLYHMGETEDLGLVVERLRERYSLPLYLLGFSLGGNVVLKWLGETGATGETITAAAAISAPYNPTIGAAQIHKQLGGLYMKAFLQSLLPKALLKEAQFPGTLDLEAVQACRHFEDFDTHVTARLHGFTDAQDYWEKVGAHQFLEHIRVPTLLLSAADDPFNPEETLPRTVAAESPWLHGVFPQQGGHIGFVYGESPDAPRFWAEEQVARFFQFYGA